MRELKFRAWDSENKKMTKPSELEDMCLKASTIVGFVWDMSIPIMQYTGECDKDGREIYEGDIMDYMFEGDDPCPFEVVFMDGCFRKRYEKWNSDFSYPNLEYGKGIKTMKLKIIGNIHENPELL
jgi:uncharacterized phage protein (TIGR01671 family)